MHTKSIIEDSLSLKATTLSYSDNYVLTISGVLNIYNDLTESDCKAILTSTKLSQIQFARSFKVSDRTFTLINNHLLLGDTKPSLSISLNGFDAVNSLDFLIHLPNLKSLTVDTFGNNEIHKINRYLKLTTLGLGGNISIKEIALQKDLVEIFLFGKLRDVETISTLTKLKKATFSKMTLKNLNFLKSLKSLRELHFFLGTATNYEGLPEIEKLEKLSFTWVKKLTHEHLLPINKMKCLKELKFDTIAGLTDLNWLTNKNLKVEIVGCKKFQK